MGGTDRQTPTQTNRHTDAHFNIMTRPGLGAGPSENADKCDYFLALTKESTLKARICDETIFKNWNGELFFYYKNGHGCRGKSGPVLEPDAEPPDKLIQF